MVDYNPCLTCAERYCSGATNCPAVLKEDRETLSTPIPVRNDRPPKIPADIYPVLLRSGIQPPLNGTILIEWDKEQKKVRLLVHDNDKPKKKNKWEHYVVGKESFKRTKLHWRKGALVKIER